MTVIIYKEARLSLCAPAILLLFSSAMMLIPQYPYLVVSFYGVLGIMFVCLFSRENRDLAFTAALPAGRKTIVAGRFMLCTALEITQILMCAAFAALRPAVGLSLSLELAEGISVMSLWTFFGLSLCATGVFNLVFFPWYFRDPRRVGIPFIIASLVYPAGIVAGMLWTLPQGAGMLGAGLIAYIVLSWGALKLSERFFERVNVA